MKELRSLERGFEAPPVVETALAVQFSELRPFRSVHFGRFHELIRNRFPVSEDHPRVEAINEDLERIPRHLRLQLIQKPHGPERVLFRDSFDGSLLVQLQPDRFGFNWRRTEGTDYPSFEKNGRLFLDEFQKFKDFCDSEKIGPVCPDWIEVVYVNHILPDADKGESVIQCFGSIFQGLSWTLSSDFLPLPEAVAFNRVYPIANQRGRLYVEAGISRNQSEQDCILLKLTSRVRKSENEVLPEALQTAHDYIVHGFAEVTTEEARIDRWRQST